MYVRLHIVMCTEASVWQTHLILRNNNSLLFKRLYPGVNSQVLK